MRTLLLPSMLLLLAACATGPSYGPADRPGALGYSDRPIEADRYRVSYRARNLIEAEDGALRRAADLTLQNGYDWFTIVTRSADAEGVGRSSGASVGIGGSTGGFGRSGVGLGVQLPLGRRDAGETVVSLEVVMGTGPEPDGPQTYDATAVLGNLNAPGL
ncbi:CC0125/CC1285 family lipoprotein [Parvularcula oceani]|uniref:CC0125/CC1285 family lipoprotein n=1 Tax=Parvularcula oceani TaxID=1247963 RepID=UPI0004E23A12|nr:hypothetical protein [Parvularcula oceani]